MIRELKTKLVDLGLTDKEAAVYLGLLQKGSATADEAAKLANLNRSTTYVQLKVLMKLGLVSTFKRGKKTYFAAESPNNLERVLEAKTAELENRKSQAAMLVPELMHIFTTSGARPLIRTFEGKEGLTSMRHEILHSGEEILYTACSFDDLYKLYTTKELMEYSKMRASKGITSYVIYNKKGDDAVTVAPQQLKRVDKNNMPISSDLYIYGDTVSIASTSGQIVGLTIMNKQIADTMKTLFTMAWGKPIEEQK